jgi:hypothetical protein
VSGQRFAYLVAIVTIMAAAASPAAEASRQIDIDTAIRLAGEAYNWSTRYIWYDRRDHSFLIVAPLGGELEAPVTWLAVNPWTGDVWDVWRCEKLSTARLRKSQAAIRWRFRLDELKDYGRLRALKPVCYGP